MIKQDIPLYKLDLTANSKYNSVLQESKRRTKVENNHIFIPPKGPFYQKTFKMFDRTGKQLVEGVDYEFYGIMAKLTQYTGKPVGLFVRILKDDILEWKMDYQVVGNFNVLTSQILNMLHGIYEDDRFVLWENIADKPLWFTPKIHQHDLAYDIYGFTDLVKELNRLATYAASVRPVFEEMLSSFQDHLQAYITSYKKVIRGLVDSHDANQANAHGVTNHVIGLGNVDNIATATLDETLEGLRDDLRITVYNAAKVAEASSGRNDKLFPSGSLPLLRYGSDTFIPPTISGSFEGLGGTSRRVGAVVETDGTLLILQHRNNGKYRGLYFVRCGNWQTTTPNYDFTAYMYQHPTATAAGATLDCVINGSNRYVMVVGDSKKNLWWWCETFGTLNPDRHVLIPLSGEWVSQDMAMPYSDSDIYNMPGLASVVADENYRDYWGIMQAYRVEEFLKRRPQQVENYEPNNGDLWGNGLFIVAGHSWNIVASKSSTIKRAKVSFNHPIYGDFNDEYFSPWFPKVEDVNGQKLITSCFGIYNPPIRSVVSFRSPVVHWLGTGKFGEFNFRYEHAVTSRAVSGAALHQNNIYRGSLKVVRSGADFILTVTPGLGFEKLWTIDIDNQTPENQEWAQYRDYVGAPWYPTTMDQNGAVALTGGHIVFTGGTGNVSFPPQYLLLKSDYLSSAADLLLPRTGGYGGTILSNVTTSEKNPVGMGTQFGVQRLMSADSSDYTKAGVLVRQFEGKKGGWFFRPMPFMNSNWDHVEPPLTSTFGGQSFKHFPFTPAGYNVDMGLQVFPGTQMPLKGANNSSNQLRMMGANSDTTLNGVQPDGWPNGEGMWIGDQLLQWETRSSIVEGVMKVRASVVIDLKDTITNIIIPAFKAIGFTEDDVRQSWSMHMALSPNGTWQAIWMAFSPRVPKLKVAAMVTTMGPAGTGVSKGEYVQYPTSTATIIGPARSYELPTQIASNKFTHIWGEEAGSRQALFIGTPYKALNNNVMDTSAYVVVMSTATRYESFGGIQPAGVQIEIAPNGVIQRLDNIWIQDWGNESGITATPFYGLANANIGAEIFEGAVIGAMVIDKSTNIYDKLAGNVSAGINAIGMSNILTPQYTVYFQQQLGVLLAGKMYDIPATFIDILTLDANPANKVFYVYLQYVNSRATYTITRSVLPESSSQSMIAKVVCGPTQIDRIEPYNRFTMDGAAISAVRKGSSILASSGSVMTPGLTNQILLDDDYIS